MAEAAAERLRTRLREYWEIVFRDMELLVGYFYAFENIGSTFFSVKDFKVRYQKPLIKEIKDEKSARRHFEKALKKYLVDEVIDELLKDKSLGARKKGKVTHLFKHEDVIEFIEEMKERMRAYYPFFDLEKPIGDLSSWVTKKHARQRLIEQELQGFLSKIAFYPNLLDNSLKMLNGFASSDYIYTLQALLDKVRTIFKEHKKKLDGFKEEIFLKQNEWRTLLFMVNDELVTLTALYFLILRIEDLVHENLVLIQEMLKEENKLKRNSGEYVIKGPAISLKGFVYFKSAGIMGGDFYIIHPESGKKSDFAEIHVVDTQGKGIGAAKVKREFMLLERHFCDEYPGNHDGVSSKHGGIANSREKFEEKLKEIAMGLLASQGLGLPEQLFFSFTSMMVDLKSKKGDNFFLLTPAPCYYVSKGESHDTIKEKDAFKHSPMFNYMGVENPEETRKRLHEPKINAWKLFPLELRKGDLIVLTTDGLTEAKTISQDVNLNDVYDINNLLKQWVNKSPKEIVDLFKLHKKDYESGEFLMDFAERVYGYKKDLASRKPKLGVIAKYPSPTFIKQVKVIMKGIESLPEDRHKKFWDELKNNLLLVLKEKILAKFNDQEIKEVLAKFNKQDIKEIELPEIIELSKRIDLSELIDWFLEYEEKHHKKFWANLNEGDLKNLSPTEYSSITPIQLIGLFLKYQNDKDKLKKLLIEHREPGDDTCIAVFKVV